jgi:hypothetical protein
MPRLAVLALLSAACVARAGQGGRELAGRPGGGDPHVEVACVLVPDGGLCTFTALGKPGGRCIKLLYGASSGTVAASDDVCSGWLAAGESSTRVAHFSTRPGVVCGKLLSECESRPVAPATSLDTATAWQAELKQNNSGPITDADCKKLNEHKYEIYTHADCDRVSDPIQRDACFKNVREEREREMPYLVQDCVEYYQRPRFNCEMKAGTQDELDGCEEQFP